MSQPYLRQAFKQLGVPTHWHFPSVNSTNTQAANIAAGMTANQFPLLVTCDQQTAGRGRGTNQWWQGQGGLAFSIVTQKIDTQTPTMLNSRTPAIVASLPSRDSQDHEPLQQGAIAPQWYSIWTSICLHRTAKHFLPNTKCHLKWPNDLLIHDRKNAGILIEPVPNFPQRYTVGIGVNVNNQIHTADDSVVQLGYSWSETGQTFPLDSVIEQFLKYWLAMSFQTPDQQSSLLNEFRANDWLEGKNIRLNQAGQQLEGKYLGVSAQGFLKLKFEDGTTHTFATCDNIRPIALA